jgi:hypothetical protein
MPGDFTRLLRAAFDELDPRVRCPRKIIDTALSMSAYGCTSEPLFWMTEQATLRPLTREQAFAELAEELFAE